MSATMISLIRAASQNVEAVAAHEGHSPDWLAGFRACLIGLEQAAPLQKDDIAALDEHQTCRPDGKPVPITGPRHGPGIPDQFRLLRSLVGTDHPRGRQNMRDIIDYLESVCPNEPPTPATPEEIATAIELFGAEDIEIDSDAQASHGDDGTWVSAWVLIPNDEEDDDQPDDFAEDDVDPVARKARIL